MDIEKIKLLAKKGESASIEFKTSTAQLKAAFETVCALLNNKGGTVLIGINDNGKTNLERARLIVREGKSRLLTWKISFENDTASVASDR